MATMRLKDLLAELKKKNIHISKRTFEYYQSLGFLPKPIKKVGSKGRGLYGYYDFSIILKLLKFINSYKNKGYTLSQIREFIIEEVMKKYDAQFQKYGFSGLSGLEELFDYLKLENEVLEHIRRKEKKQKKQLPPSLLKTIKSLEVRMLRMLKHPFRLKMINPYRSGSEFIKELKWWDADEKYEILALKRIRDFCWMIGPILGSSQGIIADNICKSLEKEKKLTKNIQDFMSIRSVLERKLNRIDNISIPIEKALKAIQDKYEKKTKN